MTAEEHKKFRSTKVWKEFRLKMLALAGNECQLCGTKYTGKRTKMLHCHHTDPDAYTTLDPTKFRVVCATCHKFVIERFVKKNNWGQYSEIWYSLLKPFGVNRKETK